TQLHNVSASCYTLLRHVKPATAIPAKTIKAMTHFALDAGLRSFDQGLAAAVDYVHRDDVVTFIKHCMSVGGVHSSFVDIQRVELAAIAEGHTRRIVRITAWCKGRETPVVAGLNIVLDMTEAAD